MAQSNTDPLAIIPGKEGNETTDNLKIDLLPGSELQGGIGNFGDPTAHHGFSLSLNGSLGVSSKATTFGYDAFSVNTRWVPGTNKLGRRIIIQFGAANWFTPSLASVYKDTVLTATEKLSEAKTVNNVMAGLSFQLAKNRDKVVPNEQQSEMLKCFDDSIMKNDKNDILKQKYQKELADYTWKELIRPTMRELSIIAGGMFRLGNLGTETEITAADIFVTAAKGKDIFDFVASVHYLKPLDKDLVAKNAQTASAGFFF